MTKTTSACQRIIGLSPLLLAQELVPDEERESPQLGLQARVERWVEQPYVGEEQEKEPPLASSALAILALGFPASRLLVGVHNLTLSPSGSLLPMLLSEQSSHSKGWPNN